MVLHKITKMNILSVFMVLIIALGSSVIISLRNLEESMNSQLTDLSYIISKNSLVIQTLEEKTENLQLNRYLDDIINSTSNINIITVADASSIRYYHPDKKKIYEHFVGGDEKQFAEGVTSYLTVGKGTSKLQYRAFTQVKSLNGEVIGFVMVSTLAEHMKELQFQIIRAYVGVMLLLMVVLYAGTRLTSYLVKNALLGYDPTQFAKMYLQKTGVIDSLEEGIIAIDEKENILLMNKSAKEMLEIEEDVVEGKHITEVFPSSKLPRILKSKESKVNQEMVYGNVLILADQVPVMEDDRVVGAVSIFRNKTEVTKLAEELTGVNHIVDALRANTHEFKNKLHVILGLIQVGDTDMAREYIATINEETVSISTIIKAIENRTLAALLYGKINHAKEMGVTLELDGKSHLPAHNNYMSTHDMITVLGNLIQNAIEATAIQEDREKFISLLIYCDDQSLFITVDDTGCGIRQNDLDKIYTRGYSTKGENRGIGMKLIQDIIENHEGSIRIDSEEGEGTAVTIVINKVRRGRE